GLVRFDGDEWTVYNTSNSGLSDDTVKHLAVDGKGGIWCANVLKLSYFDGSQWTVYPVYDKYGLGISCMDANQGYVWYGTIRNAVYRFDGTTSISYSAGYSYVSAIKINQNGNLFIGSNSKISIFDNSKWMTYGTNVGDVISFTNEKNGNMWCAGEFRFCYYDGNSFCTFSSWKFDAGFEDPYSENKISFVTVDTDNTLWIVLKNGVYTLSGPIVSLSGFEKEIYNPGETVNINWVSNQSHPIDIQYSMNDIDWINIAEDIDSNLKSFQWEIPDSLISSPYINKTITIRIAADDVYIPNNDFSFVLERFDPGESFVGYYTSWSYATCFTEDTTGAMWVGKDPGLWRFTGAEWESFDLAAIDTLFTEEDMQEVLDAASDTGGGSWFAMKAGLLHYDDETWETIFPGKYISQVAADQSGAVWFAAAENDIDALYSVYKLYKYKDGAIETIATPWDNHVTGISVLNFSPDGELFVFRSGMVAKFNGTNWETFTDINPDPPRYPNKLVWDSAGNIWACDYSNMYSFSFDTGTWTAQTLEIEGSYGFSPRINDIDIDESGVLWVVADNRLHALRDDVLYPYSSTYGWDIDEISMVHITTGNIKWLGGDGYVYRLDETISPTLVTREPQKIFALTQNYPNPFNPITMIEYIVPYAADVTLTIYNTSGQRVSVLKEGFQQAGSYSAMWDATEFPSGLYFAVFEAGGYRASRKMMLVK
ncbi:T9SS type A sorting domain-containing protein, partial [Candidatus Latescibacterota bacterium]